MTGQRSCPDRQLELEVELKDKISRSRIKPGKPCHPAIRENPATTLQSGRTANPARAGNGGGASGWGHRPVRRQETRRWCPSYARRASAQRIAAGLASTTRVSHAHVDQLGEHTRHACAWTTRFGAWRCSAGRGGRACAPAEAPAVECRRRSRRGASQPPGLGAPTQAAAHGAAAAAAARALVGARCTKQRPTRRADAQLAHRARLNIVVRRENDERAALSLYERGHDHDRTVLQVLT